MEKAHHVEKKKPASIGICTAYPVRVWAVSMNGNIIHEQQQHSPE
jgi:hypothetical protein